MEEKNRKQKEENTKTFVRECELCGIKIHYVFRRSEEDLPDEHICARCEAWEVNSHHRKLYVKTRLKENPEAFNDWVRRRNEEGNPVDDEVMVAFMSEEHREIEWRKQQVARGTRKW